MIRADEPWYHVSMETKDFDYILIREFSVLVRVPRGASAYQKTDLELFDMRTGVQVPAIIPEVNDEELSRGYKVSAKVAAAIIKSGHTILELPAVDLSKVTNLQDIKQRKLDVVVADSILDQVQKIADVLRNFLKVAESASKEERFWLSQQALTLVRKFSGRELAEMENVVEWLGRRSRRE